MNFITHLINGRKNIKLKDHHFFMRSKVGFLFSFFVFTSCFLLFIVFNVFGIVFAGYFNSIFYKTYLYGAGISIFFSVVLLGLIIFLICIRLSCRFNEFLWLLMFVFRSSMLKFFFLIIEPVLRLILD